MCTRYRVEYNCISINVMELGRRGETGIKNKSVLQNNKIGNRCDVRDVKRVTQYLCMGRSMKCVQYGPIYTGSWSYSVFAADYIPIGVHYRRA